MKIAILVLVFSVAVGCTTIGDTVSYVVSPEHTEFGTKMQAKSYRKFAAMLSEHNAKQDNDEKIYCEPRKRDNGRFTYVHCEFFQNRGQLNNARIFGPNL